MSSDDELRRAATFLERLLEDPQLRADFRRRPATTCRAFELDGLADELDSGERGTATLELRESRSGLAGVMIGVAAEGLGLAELLARHASDLGNASASQLVARLGGGPDKAQAAAPPAGSAPPHMASPAGSAPPPADPSTITAAPSTAAGAPPPSDPGAAPEAPPPATGTPPPADPSATTSAPAPATGSPLPTDPGAATTTPRPATGAAPAGLPAAGPAGNTEAPAGVPATYPPSATQSANPAPPAGLPATQPAAPPAGESSAGPSAAGGEAAAAAPAAAPPGAAPRAAAPSASAPPGAAPPAPAAVSAPPPAPTGAPPISAAALAADARAIDPSAVVESSGQRAVELAKQHLGESYVWGGASPQTGFDCSGLVQYAYSQVGVQLPRVTEEQIGVGRPVGLSELRTGDMVFFRDPSGDVHHVGLYLDHGRFLHAPHTGDVIKISSLDEPYYASQFAGGRRVGEVAAAVHDVGVIRRSAGELAAARVNDARVMPVLDPSAPRPGR